MLGQADISSRKTTVNESKLFPQMGCKKVLLGYSKVKWRAGYLFESNPEVSLLPIKEQKFKQHIR